MTKKHKYSASFEDIGSLFEEAADTGSFDFGIAPYEDFIAFIKEYSPGFTMQIGKRDPEFIAELHRLRDLAYSMQGKE